MPAAESGTGRSAILAPAKINLALHVCGRRADGFHLLDSLVVFADVGDHITVAPATSLTLDITGPFAGALAPDSNDPGPDNLVLRAARWLAARANVAHGAQIRLEKNLPVASGIGGGSADAAATLAACAALWNVEITHLPAAEVAAALGADVPVCLTGRPAMMRGIGEDITLAPPLPAAWLVLANPGVPLATKAVFGALRGRFTNSMPALPSFPSFDALVSYLSDQRNDLAAPALELLPVIGSVLHGLEMASGCHLARLSGSGPTCFGLFRSEEAAKTAATGLKSANPGWWVAPAALSS